METVRVMSAFHAPQRMLTVYNRENFRGHSTQALLRNTCRMLYVSILLLSLLFESVVVLWPSFSTGLNLVAQSIPLAGFLETTRSQLVFFTLWSKNRMVTKTIAHLQSIIDKRNEKSMDAILRYSRLEASLTRIFRFLLGFSLPSIAGVFAIVMAVSMFTSAPNMLPVNAAGPNIDTSTNSGYFTLLLLEFLGAIGHSTVMISTVVLFVGICFYIDDMVKDLATELAKVDRHLLLPSKHGPQRETILPYYIDQIEFHKEIIWLAEATGFIMNGILFHQLITCAIMEALCLTSLEADGIFSPDNSVILYIFSGMMMMTYVFCYLSETITRNLHDVGRVFYESAWFLLPVRQQLIFHNVIERSQITFHLKGLGLIDCSLAVFWAIIRTGCSYFLMIRGLK